MDFDIYAVTYEAADLLRPFIRSEVWEMPAKEAFWYFAALDTDGSILGAAVIDPIQARAELVSIGVAGDRSGQGIGTALLAYAKQILAQAGIRSLAMEYILPQEEWGALDRLMDAADFVLMEQDYVYEVPFSELAAHPQFQMKIPQQVQMLAESSEVHKKQLLYAVAEEMEIDPVILHKCDPEMSFFWKSTEDIDAALFLSKPENGVVDILWMWLAKDAKDPRALMLLLAAAVQKGRLTLAEDTKILCTCLNEHSEDILLYFLPEIQPKELIRNYLALTAYERING